MEKLKSIVQRISKGSIFTQIIQEKTVQQRQFNEAAQQHKQRTLNEIFNTFKRQRSTRAVMTALLLIDYLGSLQPEITLFSNCSEPKLSKENSVGNKKLSMTEKQFVAEEQFIKFYFNFLKSSCKKRSIQIDFHNCSLKQWIEYCQISVKQILELIRIDFVISFMIKNCKNQRLLKMALESIFQKVSFDIRIVNRFLQKHLRIVTQKHEQAFRVNQIYQKTIFINTNFLKLHAITRNFNKKIKLEEYEVDKQVNRSIQIQMYQRQDDKRDFLVSSRKQIEEKDEKQKESELEDGAQALTVEGDTMVRLNDLI